MKKSEIKNTTPYFDYYIQLNKEEDLMEAFENSLLSIDKIDVSQYKEIGQTVYAKDKWTILQVLQHIIDWERIWCYRTLLFVRKEGTIPIPLDEEKMANNGNANLLSVEQLLYELKAVRLSTKAMFQSFPEETLSMICKSNHYEMSVLAMGFNILGHQIHHLKIIEERYLL